MDQIEARRYTVWTARAIGYLAFVYVAVTEIILLLGFVLKAFGANPDVGFTQWAYRNLDRVMAPFRGIFGTIELGTNGNNVQAVLDMSIVFAMVIYGILLLVLRALIDWLSMRIHLIDDKRAAQESAAKALASSAAPSATVFAPTTAAPTTVPPTTVPPVGQPPVVQPAVGAEGALPPPSPTGPTGAGGV